MRNASFLMVALFALGGCRPVSVGDDGATVRVMVYNIHAGKDGTGTGNLARVAALVRESGADIVLLQEVDVRTRRSGGVDQVMILAQYTGFHAAFGKTLDYQDGEYGVATLSRWPVTSEGLVPLPIDPPQARAGGSYEPRGVLRVVVASPSGSIIVLNTHLDASGDDHYRRQEVRTVLAIADSARARGDASVIVGGDFNSTPGSAVQATMRLSPMRDVWPLCGRGDGLTYPADSAVKRIDYLYIDGRATCDNARVLVTDASDHRPLFVILKLHPR